MIPRVLEPEVMHTVDEAADYDAMDHSVVNRLFVDDLLTALPEQQTPIRVLDVGTGTAQIPIELAGRNRAVHITGVDLAEEMLIVGRRNVARAGITCIDLQKVDAKRLPYVDASFDIVMSNSIVHHIPEPAGAIREMRRVLRPDGLLFVRDLLRPETDAELEDLIAAYAGDESPQQRQLFRQSLHAALTLDELRLMLPGVGIELDSLRQTSDRHWTISAIV